MDSSVSVIIPARNEPYLQKTIDSVIDEVLEVIVVLDGYLPDLKPHPKLRTIHYGEARGMRNAINSAATIARGDYLLKTDAHCKFEPGFAAKLTETCKDKTIVVPRRYRLDPEKWEIIQDGRPPIDKMRLTADLHGRDWQEGNTEDLIEETPSSQGSCWFMSKDYFNELELMDESTYGSFWSEFQEIGLKCWLSGGQVLVDKRTNYAHWHKDKRGYTLNEKNEMREFSWHKQIHPIEWMWEHFPMPK